MSNAEHLASVMVEQFIKAVDNGVDLVPVVADSTSTAKLGRLSHASLIGWSTLGLPNRRWWAWRSAYPWGGKLR